MKDFTNLTILKDFGRPPRSPYSSLVKRLPPSGKRRVIQVYVPRSDRASISIPSWRHSFLHR